jgi:hypothetical protein
MLNSQACGKGYIPDGSKCHVGESSAPKPLSRLDARIKEREAKEANGNAAYAKLSPAQKASDRAALTEKQVKEVESDPHMDDYEKAAAIEEIHDMEKEEAGNS